MNALCHQLSRAASTLLMLGAGLGSLSAMAADKPAVNDTAARYQQERAVCMSGQSNQDRATCLREAGAAFAQARRGELEDDPSKHARNANRRCEPLPDDDRRACMSRMEGQGSTSGSVAAGGIYRELVTREVAMPSMAKPEGGTQGVPMK